MNRLTTNLIDKTGNCLFHGCPKGRGGVQNELAKTRTALTKQLAISYLKQLGVTGVMVGITCAFTSSGFATLFSVSGVSLLISFAAKAQQKRALYYKNVAQFDLADHENQLKKYDPFLKFENERKQVETYCRHMDEFVKEADYVSALAFTSAEGFSGELMIHEGGHAAAGSALYQHANAHITLTPSFNPLKPAGSTTFSPSDHLTALGEHLGHHASEMVVAGAGTGATFIASIICLIVAHKIRKNHPHTSRTLTCIAIVSIVNSIFYALSTLWSSSKANDFIQLAAGGVSPFLAIAVLALPLIIKGGMAVAEYVKGRKAQAQIEAAA